MFIIYSVLFDGIEYYYIDRKIRLQKMNSKNTFATFKENDVYGFRKSTSKLINKSKNSQVSLTQSLFSSNKNSMKNISHQNTGLNDFCQTLTSGFGGSWVRPESKHASRKQANRPQTSKGARTFNQAKQRNLFGEYQQFKNHTASKSMHNCCQQLCTQKQTQNQLCLEEKQNYDDSAFKNIRIVVTRNQKPRKEKSFYSDKFQTNLPDDFLSLFAD